MSNKTGVAHPDLHVQPALWNLTDLAYCGYGFDFGKIPVPFQVTDSNPDQIQTIFDTVLKNLAFLMLKATLFPRKLTSHFDVLISLTFVFHFMLGPDSNPNPECIMVSVPVRQEVPVPVLISQHCFQLMDLDADTKYRYRYRTSTIYCITLPNMFSHFRG